jgi:hypothetical protein
MSETADRYYVRDSYRDGQSGETYQRPELAHVKDGARMITHSWTGRDGWRASMSEQQIDALTDDDLPARIDIFDGTDDASPFGVVEIGRY